MKTLPEAEAQNKAQLVKVKKQGLFCDMDLEVVYPNLPTVPNCVPFYCTVLPEPDPVFFQ